MGHFRRSLVSRFFREFFRKFGATMRESPFDKLVVASAVAYVIGHGLLTDRWEWFTTLVMAVGLLVILHAFQAAYAVSKEITEEIGTGKGAGFAPAVAVPHEWHFYRLKLYGLACVLSGICVLASLFVWHREIRVNDSDPAYRGKVKVNVFDFQVRNIGTVASFTVRNIGKYRIVPTAMIKGAIIISPVMSSAEDEDELFRKQPEWQSGCLTLGNYLEPNGNEIYCHVTYPWAFGPEEQDDLINKRKVLYVLTRTLARDTQGNLPVSDTCRYFLGPDFNNPPHECFDHNN